MTHKQVCECVWLAHLVEWQNALSSVGNQMNRQQG